MDSHTLYCQGYIWKSWTSEFLVIKILVLKMNMKGKESGQNSLSLTLASTEKKMYKKE